ncbi:hypothetical protein EYF80_064097 [Liparis tanakae]|uniref:Uncharacterized protein n=1 Tax=Liparis tanakae TaxID=230148 RepID=A0A4Z2EAJ0_9TELE|nr:hypothetical protein EYF80_064097 [Liparis tanakae]
MHCIVVRDGALRRAAAPLEEEELCSLMWSPQQTASFTPPFHQDGFPGGADVSDWPSRASCGAAMGEHALPSGRCSASTLRFELLSQEQRSELLAPGCWTET